MVHCDTNNDKVFKCVTMTGAVIYLNVFSGDGSCSELCDDGIIEIQSQQYKSSMTCKQTKHTFLINLNCEPDVKVVKLPWHQIVHPSTTVNSKQQKSWSVAPP